MAVTAPTSLPDYPTALARALALVTPTADLESVELAHANGRVLRAGVCADRDLPPFHRAQMDGYALRHDDLTPNRPLPVARTVPAGAPPGAPVEPGTCVAIATGAPVPGGADTVIQHEYSDRADPVSFTATVPRGHAIHPAGSDARAGSTVLAPPLLLAPHHLGIAASVGAVQLAVARRLRAVVLTSGDEVVAPHLAPAAHQIRNSNGIQTLGLLARMGAEPAAHEHIADEREATERAVAAAIDRADLIVTVGGVSAGDRDWFPTAFDAAGVERAVHGALIQPGKPVIAGRAPNGALVLALPGNPVSSLACSCLFAWPMVRAWLGLDAALPWRFVTVTGTARPNARRQAFRPAVLANDGSASIPVWQGSGDLAHTGATDGLLALPVRPDEVTDGTTLPFLPWP